MLDCVDWRSPWQPGAWLVTHWAPYWWTCDICSPASQPHFVLKTESLPSDIPVVLQALGLHPDIVFPLIRVSGLDEDFSEENQMSHLLVRKYFSLLTRQQILELWDIYKTDFLLFDYSIEKYLHLENVGEEVAARNFQEKLMAI